MFTLGAFRLWQLTDLWHININYAVQPRARSLREWRRGEGRVARGGTVDVVDAGCGCFYLLAATNDDDATKSALNTHYVGGSWFVSLPLLLPLPLLPRLLPCLQFALLHSLRRTHSAPGH